MAIIDGDMMPLGDGSSFVKFRINDANHRLHSVEWSLAAGHTARVRVWNSDNLVYDQAYGGPASGTESVPGNVTMVWSDDGSGSFFWDFPPEITYSFNVEKIG